MQAVLKPCKLVMFFKWKFHKIIFGLMNIRSGYCNESSKNVQETLVKIIRCLVRSSNFQLSFIDNV